MSAQQNSISELVDRLTRFEKETGIAMIKLGGFHFWDVLRHKIYSSMSSNTGLFAMAHRYASPSIGDMIPGLFVDLRSLVSLCRCLNNRHDYIVFSSSRRLYDNDTGRWKDPYTDDLVAHLNGSACVLEKRLFGKHFCPVAQPPVYYYDFAFYLGRLVSYVIAPLLFVSREERLRLISIGEHFRKEFNYSIPLLKMVRREKARHMAMVHVFRVLLKRSKAKAVFLVCSYGKEALVDACQKLKIKSIELQHGTISNLHPGYNFPQWTRKKYFPDEFWAFGRFWAETVMFPSHTRVRLGLGFPYLNIRIRKLKQDKKIPRILVISQGTIGKELSKFLLESLPFIDPDIEILYKLHPGERTYWRRDYPWLIDTSDRIKVLERDDPDLYDLMASSRWQVGVYSTALYEGMRLNCRTILVKLPGFENLTPAIIIGAAILIENPRQMVEALGSCKDPNGGVFFDPTDWTILKTV